MNGGVLVLLFSFSQLSLKGVQLDISTCKEENGDAMGKAEQWEQVENSTLSEL